MIGGDELKVCTVPVLSLGPRAPPGPRAGPGPGPDSTDNVRVQAGFGPGSNDSNQMLNRIFRAFSGHSLFAKKKLFVVTLMLCSLHSRAPETNPTDLIFSGIFVAARCQK
jgi:hypothetical protein